ncbi:MAG: hypothetical protein Q7J85_08765 [Bacillota bacterium]|nr:hypothetical protein [Bacillota bacterium]
MQDQVSEQRFRYIACFLFLTGIGFLIASFLFFPPLTREILSANDGKLALLIRLEFTALGIFLAVFSILVISKKVQLSDLKYLGLSLVPVQLFLGLGFWQIWVADDAIIIFPVVRNLLSGHGLVFNVGERVEVYTPPLWLGILAIWDYLTGEIELAAAWLGLLFSGSGLFLGQWGAITLLRKRNVVQKAAFFPLGSLIVVALPPFWDYASSGLETGLGIFWLGLSFFLLARDHPGQGWWKTAGALLWFGLGPLIRPDFIIFSAGLILLIFVLHSPGSFRRFVSLGIAAIFFPAAYQVFRMGYFASLYPNTALAKSATSSYWSFGYFYLQDLFLPYMLFIPLLLVVIALEIQGVYLYKQNGGRSAVICGTVAVLGVLYAFFIVRGGGDFMHGRFLLPALFAFQLPVSCIVFPSESSYRRLLIPLLVGMTLWSAWCAGWGRVPYGLLGPHGVADERGVYVFESGAPNPVTLSDYGQERKSLDQWAVQANEAATIAIHDRHILSGWGGIGGFAAGPAGYNITGGGLSDPVTSRFRIKYRGRPGHEKGMTPVRESAYLRSSIYNQHTVELLNTGTLLYVDVFLAGKVLASSPLADLLAAVHEQLTFQRFFSNILLAWQTRSLQIPIDPYQAASEFCSPSLPWLDALLSREDFQRVLILEKNSALGSSGYEASFANSSPDGYILNFEFKSLAAGDPGTLTVELIVEDFGGKSYSIDYELEYENGYRFAGDLREEMDRVFGEQAPFYRLQRIAFRGKEEYLLANRFLFYGEPEPAVYIAEIDSPKSEGTSWDAPGNIIISEKGLWINLGEQSRAKHLEISLDHNDDYQLHFLNGDLLLADRVVQRTMRGGLSVHTLDIPAEAAAEGFDRVWVFPLRGDNMYSIGHITFFHDDSLPVLLR